MGKWKGSRGGDQFSYLDEYDKSMGWFKDDSAYASTSTKPSVRCYHSHPELKILNGVIVGRSCTNPKDGYDVYIGLDSTMKYSHPRNPWDDSTSKVVEGCYPITDMNAPKEVKKFTRMIEWMTAQLSEGARIHIGCFGGHGRTGTVLAALAAVALNEKNAIQWVRDKHCAKAVESQSQIDYLMKHFGVSAAEPTKTYAKPSGGPTKGAVTSIGSGRRMSDLEKSPDRVYRFVRTEGSIWD